MINKIDANNSTEAEIAAEIKRLTKELDNFNWPKTTKIYLHRNKESNYDTGEELGLSEEALDNFRYTGYEVEIKIEVHQDGTAYATHFGKVELKEKVKI